MALLQAAVRRDPSRRGALPRYASATPLAQPEWTSRMNATGGPVTNALAMSAH